MENTTIIQKLQAKKNKKGFTLVELVIVIAILAILAAIAIPVIVSTINSANLSTFESDKATIEMLLKAAINENKAGVHTLYTNATTPSADKKDVAKGSVTIADIAKENGFNGSLKKNVNGTDYYMVWDGLKLEVKAGSDVSTDAICATTTINSKDSSNVGGLTGFAAANDSFADINTSGGTSSN